MKGFGLGSTLSSRVFVYMTIAAVTICSLATAALIRISDGEIERARLNRDNEWAAFMPAALGSVTGAESQYELAAILADLGRKYSFLRKIEILDSDAQVVLSVSDRAEDEWLEGGRARGSFTAPLEGFADRSVRVTVSPAAEVSGARHRAKIFAVLAAMLMAFFSMFYYLVHTVVRKPIRQLLSASRILASNTGDLTAKIDISSHGELGRLGATLNDMFSNIAGIINVIRTTADKVNFSAQSLSASTEEMNSITEETSTTVQNLSLIHISEPTRPY